MSVIFAGEPVKYYWGNCPNPAKRKGQKIKIHHGHQPEDFIHDDDTVVIKTHCGNQMLIKGEGERPSHLDEESEELCRTCHRSYAWQYMMEAMAKQRQVEDEIARKLDVLAAKIENNELNDIGAVKEIKGLAQDLRHTVQGVPTGNRKPELKLVVNGS